MLIKARCLHNATANCSDCLLRTLCLPVALGPEEFETVVSVIEGSLSFHRDQHIYTAGDPFTSIYVVKSGAIKTLMLSDQGTEQITGFYLPAETFGMASIAFPRYNNTAVALETSAVCEIPFAKLETLNLNIPTLQRHFFDLMSREINRDQQLITLLSKHSAEERVASLLLSISARNHQRKLSSSRFRLPMSRADIGNYLGLTVETVSRILSRFQKQRLLNVDKKELEILNFDALKAITCG